MESQVHRSREGELLTPDADVAFNIGNKELIPEWVIAAKRAAKAAERAAEPDIAQTPTVEAAMTPGPVEISRYYAQRQIDMREAELAIPKWWAA